LYTRLWIKIYIPTKGSILSELYS